MYKITFKVWIVFGILIPNFHTQNVRKYKVEEEAMKLYKQDFKSVLKRFRRTPDYLKILQEKLADLKTTTREMNLQVLHYYHGKMEDHVAELLPNTTTPQAQGLRAADDEKYKNYFHGYGNRKQLADPAPTEAPEQEWQKIGNLDNYNFFNSHLSVPERNHMKELGFYYAGQVIHSIIENLQPLTSEERITLAPEENDIMKKFKTKHPKSHQVHGTSTIPEPEPLEKKEEKEKPANSGQQSDQDSPTASEHMSTKARADRNEGRFRASSSAVPNNSTKDSKKHKGPVQRASTTSEAKTTKDSKKHNKDSVKRV